jgi:hypothetical protein
LNCPNCGTSNLDTSSICANCGRPLAAPTQTYTPPPPPAASASYGGPVAPERIKNYLVPSILLTVCCCPPLGIVAIIFAAQVNQKLAAGNVTGARDASRKAKLFCLIGLVIGVLCVIAICMGVDGSEFVQGVRDGMANR